jgi:hypothetical protein
MAERGGKRKGAGRPAGSPNRAMVDMKARLSELARTHSLTAIDTLAELAESGLSETARIAAACAILDRGYGRPCEAGLTQYQKRCAGIFDD